MYLTHKRALITVGIVSFKMVSSMTYIYLVFVVMFAYLRPIHASINHEVRARSAENQQETENTNEDMSGAFSAEQGVWFPPQNINIIQNVVPFWSHYLRPMLNIFAMDANLRQTLQKEYEYELEHGSMSETEPFKLETEAMSNIENIERNEAEIPEGTLEMNLKEQSDDRVLDSSFAEGENVRSDVENKDWNTFGRFGMELETNEKTSNMFPESEAMAEIVRSAEDRARSDASSNLEESFIERDQMNGESDGGESPQMEASEQPPWQFGLTGNILGAFSNSLMGLMPSINDPTELKEITETAGDEVDTSTLSLTEHSNSEISELHEVNPGFGNINFESGMNLNAVFETGVELGHTEEDVGDQGVQHQIGFIPNEFLSESLDSQHEETMALFTGESTAFQATDLDSSDDVAESFTVPTFRPTSSFLSRNFDLQNDQDSST